MPGVCSLGARCCGCGSCSAVCPKSCIVLEPDGLGFRYPTVDVEKCVGCGACERACPALTPRTPDNNRETLWAAASDEIREKSSSGGLFGVLAEAMLAHGGVVYGAAFDGGCTSVRHVRVSDTSSLDSIMRSKYLQSIVDKGVYRGVERDLRADVPVLFSGTSCQVSGLIGYLDRRHVSRNGLLCVDVICHGVPSPGLWQRWLDYQSHSERAEIQFVNFRSKKAGWLSCSVLYKYGTGKDNATRSSSCGFSDDWYMKAFLANASLRPSCFSCPSKRACGSDITLGDFWGIQFCHPDAFDDRGTSAVIINTKIGEDAISSVLESVRSGSCSLEEIIAGNPSLVRSVKPYVRRNDFLGDYLRGVSIPELMHKWTFLPSPMQRVKSLVRSAAVKTARAVGFR